jgi:hypothetical protein
MGKKLVNGYDRARRILAQEAARIIVEQGIDDYRVAKTKAAERLGMQERGSLPGNGEIEQAVAEHLLIFRHDTHTTLLQSLRRTALSAMEMLSPFAPRLVGPVLAGTAGEHSAVNLHVFADSAEQVAIRLAQDGISYRPFERRYKSRKGRSETFAAFSFVHEDSTIEATVFPYDGIRQAPMSPVDGKPMRRADSRKVQRLLEES